MSNRSQLHAMAGAALAFLANFPLSNLMVRPRSLSHFNLRDPNMNAIYKHYHLYTRCQVVFTRLYLDSLYYDSHTRLT